VTLTLRQLQTIMPAARSRALLYLDPLNVAMCEFAINTPARMAAFLAQIAVETGQLARVDENLNYSADGLMKTWPSRFTSMAMAMAYQRQPEKIANYVYALRMGNGDEASGDGWRFRGSGGIQLSFHDNHAACAAYFGMPLQDVSAWMRTPAGACRSAGWFWHANDISKYADAGDFDGACDKTNIGRKTKPIGDAIGYAKRNEFYTTGLKVLTA